MVIEWLAWIFAHVSSLIFAALYAIWFNSEVEFLVAPGSSRSLLCGDVFVSGILVLSCSLVLIIVLFLQYAIVNFFLLNRSGSYA